MKLLTITLTMAITIMFVGSAMAVPGGRTVEWETIAGKVIFDGKVHADNGLKCFDCHSKVFPMKKTQGVIKMAEIQEGKYCGACHNGAKAFSTTDKDKCGRCHGGSDEKPQVQGQEQAQQEQMVTAKSHAEETGNKLRTFVLQSDDEFYDLIDKDGIPHFSCIGEVTDTAIVLAGNNKTLISKLNESATQKGADILVINQMTDQLEGKPIIGIIGALFKSVGQSMKGHGCLLQLKEPTRDNLIEQIKKHETNNVFETYSALHQLDKQLKTEDKTLLNDVVQKAHYPALAEIASAEISELNQSNVKPQEQVQAAAYSQPQTVQEEIHTVKVKSKYKSAALKAAPSAKASVLEHVPGGMEVLKISENDKWVQVRLDMDDGSQLEGWISKDMVDDPHPLPQTVKIKSKYKTVDLKSEPSAKATVIEHVPGGMEVLKISENDKWVQIRLDMDDGSQLEGWISKKMVDVTTQRSVVTAKQSDVTAKSPDAAQDNTNAPVSGGSQTVKDPTTGMEFVPVKGGCYQMGDTFGGGKPDEMPVHQVCVDDFYMAQYDVTVGDFRKFVNDTGYKTEAEGTRYGCFTGQKDRRTSWMDPGFYQGDNNPVVCVNSNDAAAFIQWLSNKSGTTYRLPTEGEWEYAARSGGKNEKWAGTSNQSELSDYAWNRSNAGIGTHPVGTKKPNGLGLYDMSGNVLQWVQDFYDKDYYGRSPTNNPTGSDYGRARALRGGGWSDQAKDVRTALRYGMDPAFGYTSFFGFRLARTN